jgi:hypothetical protein
VDLDFDPRDLERDETRDIDMPWIELGRGPGSARDEDDPRYPQQRIVRVERGVARWEIAYEDRTEQR